MLVLNLFSYLKGTDQESISRVFLFVKNSSPLSLQRLRVCVSIRPWPNPIPPSWFLQNWETDEGY